MLYKRQNLLLAYDNFDPDILSRYDSSDYDRLITDPKIIRSKLKVNAVVSNAKVFKNLTKTLNIISIPFIYFIVLCKI